MDRGTLAVNGKIYPGHRARILVDLANDRGWFVGAELGLWDGRTFFHLLASVPDLSMVGVDAFDDLGIQDYQAWDHLMHERVIREQAKPYGNRAHILKMTTLEAAKEFPDAIFNFVFIDADHSYSGVVKDIQAWSPKVASGGILCGHDINFPGVAKAVAQELGTVTVCSDNVWLKEIDRAQ